MEGLSVSIADLIVLAGAAQRVRCPPEGYALRPGLHRSKVRGRGMDFAEARNYQAGDEIRHMEWRVTARTGRPHVKVYQEERERPVLLLVDFNPSMYFGTRVAYKTVVAARLAAILAWTAAKQGDRVGGLVYSADSHQEFTPRTRQSGVLPLLASLSAYSQQAGARQTQNPSSFNQALLRAQRLIKPGSLLVLISDFYHVDQQSERLLSRLRVHNDVLAYHICDPLELTPPPPQRYGVTDGQADLLIDMTLEDTRVDYQVYCEQRIARLQAQLQRLQSQYVQVTAQMALAPLVKQTFPSSRPRG